MTASLHFRACPLCEALCGLQISVEDGEATAIRGDAQDPFSRGHICPKGNAILDLEADPDRLRRPLRRRGKDFEEIGWDEALGEAGERLAAVQGRHGPDALAAYVGNPNVHHFGHLAYLPLLLRAFRSRNVFSASSVDQWPHQLVNWAMYGHQFLLPVPDIDHTDYFLMLGANPVASNGSLMSVPDVTRRLKDLVARGRLVVIDPRRTETAAIASEHHFVRPGTDAWFLIALLQAMQRRSAPRTEAYAGRLAGFEAAMKAVAAIDVGDTAARCGIGQQSIEAIAGDFLDAPRAVAYGRMGLSTQDHGTLCQWLLQLINLFSGNLDRPGGSLPAEPVFPLTGPGTSAGHRDRWRSRVRGLPEFAGELPVAVLAEEIVTPGEGQVRGLFTCAGNPVLSTPDGARLDALLGSLECMVSVDLYVNETTRHADYILPPASFLTQHHYDLVFNGFAVRNVARLNLPIRARGKDERADWEILNGLAGAYAAAAGKEIKPLPEPRTLIAAGLRAGGSGITLDQLEAAPHGLDLGPLKPSLLRRLQTASGCIECAPPLFLDALGQLAAPASAAAEDGFPLRLIGRRHVRSNNSWMHNAARLVKGPTRHALWLHRDDLAAAGVASGEQVRLVSARGSVEIEVEASDDLAPGVACLPHGFGHQLDGVRLSRAREVAGANYNALSDPTRLDAPSGNAALNGIPVRVERL
ncbi:molybdopterin-dependent oxidoreductase [Pseudomarimonas salicorniae]|uniref:Molybdopterin-dependent oxidoreductase n=1 Tax=Pseudomarimonas salicorniae TaxID=2933270 RepID=A0ABT0GJC3_9GAMM|nr:molybdopterin-dependent oxidoreductase [Lysobacter sp. CAU 1642]MCK7594638.1 molybdopterin-dependent oxidoreductase [Lysobacter sp. CAU 1642]